MNRHEQAVRSALATNSELGKSFFRLGIGDNPEGFITSAYRSARRGLSIALQQSDKDAAVRDELRNLRISVVGVLNGELRDAQEYGISEARKQLSIYGAKTPGVPLQNMARELQAGIGAVSARLDAQEAAIIALTLTDADPAVIVGDNERNGVLSPGDVLGGAAYWVTALLWDAFSYQVASASRKPGEFQKQVVAAIDARTTDCCLQAHGQIQPMDKPFILTGTPRYADRMDWSPFHKFCRTSIALYQPDFDMGLTSRMESDAQAMIDERAAGNFPDYHPANAFT